MLARCAQLMQPSLTATGLLGLPGLPGAAALGCPAAAAIARGLSSSSAQLFSLGYDSLTGEDHSVSLRGKTLLITGSTE